MFKYQFINYKIKNVSCLTDSRRLRGYRAEYQRNPASTSSTPRLPRSTPWWVGRKGSKARSTGVFECVWIPVISSMLILMPFAPTISHYFQQTYYEWFCLPHVFHSLSQPLKTHTIEQEGKLQYPGHHVWRHKRELYIIVHIPWMILTKSPLED